MKKIITISILLLLSFAAFSQAYTFSQRTETYSDLTGLEIAKGPTWVNQVVRFKLPFTFRYFDKSFDSLFIRGGFATFRYRKINVGGNIIDNLSGYELSVCNTAFDYSDATSNVSYTTTGITGERILKVQWKSARFRYDDSKKDYANFQIWLYEKELKVEFHYGDMVVTNPKSFDGGQTGPLVSILNTDGSDGFILNGSAATPEAKVPITAKTTFLTGSPVNGQVYVFTPVAATGLLSADMASAIHSYPNPFSEFIELENRSTLQVLKSTLLDMQGQELLTTSDGRMNTSGIPKGTYVMQIHTPQGTVVRKMIK